MQKLLIVMFCLVFLLISFPAIQAQTTGKIAGVVLDAATRDPLPGANITLVGTSLGGASDTDGKFYIINIPPGVYDLRIQFVGFKVLNIEKIQVSVNRTFEVEAKLTETTIEGEEVVVTAEKITIKKDQTNSVRNVNSEQIDVLPVQNINEVVQMQAGVVGSNFRGGRAGEVAYLIDGISVNNGFDGNGGQSVSVETDAVSDLEVIVGTFNAEYGNAMSGVVNLVTKDGGPKFKGKAFIGLSNYITSHNDIFIGLMKDDWLIRNSSTDLRLVLEGPVIGDKLTFFMNYRFNKWEGYLNGIRRFRPADYSDYTNASKDLWHSEATGDGKYQSMQNSRNHNFTGKLTWKPNTSIKLSALFTLNNGVSQEYEHYYKYIPVIDPKYYSNNYFGALSLNHLLSNSAYYDLKISYVKRESENYLYKDPLDSRYVHPRYIGTGHTGFATGGGSGQDINKNYDIDITASYDIYWQFDNTHSFKGGVQYINHEIDRDIIRVRNKYEGTGIENEFVVDPVTGKITFPNYELEINPNTDETIGIYNVSPFEIAAYVQDKMEFGEMVVNAGLRYEYFNSQFHYPSNRRNPDNASQFDDPAFMTTYKEAPPQTQLSPRFGLAYQLSDKAVVHLAYGHFSQMPHMYALYANNKFRVPIEPFSTIMGNATLKPQKTVNYELGLWLEIAKGMGLDMVVYYKDIYNLLSTSVIYSYNQIPYGLYVNKDYGNARGLEVTWDYTINNFSAALNYTLAYTRGNADEPAASYNRAAGNFDPISVLVPMPWEQRHTVNASFNYTTEQYNVSLKGRYNSGKPYTYTPPQYSPLFDINLLPYNSTMPQTIYFDLTASYNLELFSGLKGQLSFLVYNLFDNLNANRVYSGTGEPYEKIVEEAAVAQHRSDFNEYPDTYRDPSMYDTPRSIQFGFSIIF